MMCVTCFGCDVAQSSDVLCVADTCCDVDIAEVVLLWRRLHHGHDMLRCFVCLHFWVAAALSGSMISECFLLRSYYVNEHVALDGCNAFVLNEAITNRADFYVPPSKDAEVSAFV